MWSACKNNAYLKNLSPNPILIFSPILSSPAPLIFPSLSHFWLPPLPSPSFPPLPDPSEGRGGGGGVGGGGLRQRGGEAWPSEEEAAAQVEGVIGNEEARHDRARRRRHGRRGSLAARRQGTNDEEPTARAEGVIGSGVGGGRRPHDDDGTYRARDDDDYRRPHCYPSPLLSSQIRWRRGASVEMQAEGSMAARVEGKGVGGSAAGGDVRLPPSPLPQLYSPPPSAARTTTAAAGRGGASWRRSPLAAAANGAGEPSRGGGGRRRRRWRCLFFVDWKYFRRRVDLPPMKIDAACKYIFSSSATNGESCSLPIFSLKFDLRHLAKQNWIAQTKFDGSLTGTSEERVLPASFILNFI